MLSITNEENDKQFIYYTRFKNIHILLWKSNSE